MATRIMVITYPGMRPQIIVDCERTNSEITYQEMVEELLDAIVQIRTGEVQPEVIHIPRRD